MPCGTDGAAVSGVGGRHGRRRRRRRWRRLGQRRVTRQRRRRRRRLRLVGLVAGRVDGGHGDGVSRTAGEAVERVRKRRRRADPHAAAVDAIADDAAVVGRGGPAEAEGALRPRRPVQRLGSRRALGVLPRRGRRLERRGRPRRRLLIRRRRACERRDEELLAGARALGDTIALQAGRADLEPIAARAAVHAEVRALRLDQDLIGALAALDAVALTGPDPVGALAARDAVGARRAGEVVGARRTTQFGCVRGNGERHNDGECARQGRAHAPERERHLVTPAVEVSERSRLPSCGGRISGS